MRIAIIGAGFAGLTTARHLADFGHDCVVFEKAPDVGGVWSKTRQYPGLSTQNGKDTYHLSDFPMPTDYPEWPSGAQVQAYLEAYAKKFNVLGRVRLNTLVEKAEQDSAGVWTISARREGGETTKEQFDFLVVANGIFSTPAIPSFAGEAAFKAAGGVICHSSQFLNAADARGKHVVVIGYGKSSCDIAVGLSGEAQQVTVVARSLIWKMPKRLMNVLNYKYLFLTRMGEALFPYIRLKGVEKFLHGVGRPVRNSMLGTVQGVIQRQLKLKKLGVVPQGSFERIARSTVSLVTDDFFENVTSGRIVIARDTAIAGLEVQGDKTIARLSDGRVIPADIVVCGTGWHQEVPFLPAPIQEKLFDAKGNFRLYRCILPPTVKGLAFNGYNSSFFSPLSAEMGALWIADFLSGKMVLPAVEEQLRLTDERLAWMAERTDGKHARGTNIIPFSMHQVDELLEDMRLPIGGMQRFMEWQMPVKPGRYAKVAQRLKARHGRVV